MSEKLETRNIALADSQLRAEDRADGKGKMIRGYAAIFNRDSLPIRDERTGRMWIEQLAPGCFDKALVDQNCVAVVNHDFNLLLGRTTSRTLRLDQNSVGLRFECDVPDTQLGRDTVTQIKRGDLNGCSFQFSSDPQTHVWTELPDGMPLCTVHNIIRLYDVGPVTFPAYPDTTVSARKDQAAQVEMRDYIRSVKAGRQPVESRNLPTSLIAWGKRELAKPKSAYFKDRPMPNPNTDPEEFEDWVLEREANERTRALEILHETGKLPPKPKPLTETERRVKYEQSQWRVRLHEAAHAMVATELGIPFDFAELKADGGGFVTGPTVKTLARGQTDERLLAGKELIVLVAGIEAERVGNERRDCVGEHKGAGDKAMIEEVFDNHLPDVDRAEILTRAQKQARSILEYNWHTVLLIARKLGQHRKLSARDVKALIDHENWVGKKAKRSYSYIVC